MKFSSLITAALAAASSAYALGVGDPAIAPRTLTTKYVTKYWNTTIINGVGGVGAGNAGATGTVGVGVVIPSGTGNIGPTGTCMVLPLNSTGRYKYTGTVGVAPGLDVTTVLSFVTVVPTPAKNITIKTGTAGVAPPGYVHAYYGDPVSCPASVGKRHALTLNSSDTSISSVSAQTRPSSTTSQPPSSPRKWFAFLGPSPSVTSVRPLRRPSTLLSPPR